MNQISKERKSPSKDFSQYTEPVSDDLKVRLREDELEILGFLPDKSKNYTDERSIDEAFRNLDKTKKAFSNSHITEGYFVCQAPCT